MATKVRSTEPSKRMPRQFVVDGKGKRVAVLLPIEEYKELIEAMEQRDDIRAVEEAEGQGGKPITLEELEARLRAEGTLR